jgi:tRNA pseudouridine38-40 synthase
MRNIRLTVAYDGTEYHGWQVQPNRSTIQGCLVEVASRLTQERVFLLGAGRTDGGVHALGQTASFKTRSTLAPLEFQRAFNALLPPAIRVLRCEEESPDFHPRWQAQAKTYEYRIYRGRIVPPFEHRYVLHYPFPLDESAMAVAAKLFEGVHDFTAFAGADGDEEEGRQREPTREIFSAKIARTSRGSVWTQAFAASAEPVDASGLVADANACRESTTGAAEITAQRPQVVGEELAFTVRGRSFLRFMVRKMVGTLLEIGRGRLTSDDILRQFELRDRSAVGPTCPPQGLFLLNVEYPDRWRL